MAIFEASPFNNENIIAGLKIQENSAYTDEFHVTEANRTFRFDPKPYIFGFGDLNGVKYHQLDANPTFVGTRWRLTRIRPYVTRAVNPWTNEAIQRNYSCSHIDPEDNDIVILSDIDEIVDQRVIDKVVDQVRKFGIVTIGLHMTMYFFDLFVSEFPGPPDYSYRVFAMTGAYFRKLPITLDKLRKLGEHGALIHEVHRIPGFCGFHHSWIGDTNVMVNKIQSYSHSRGEHANQIYDSMGIVQPEAINDFVRSGISLYGGTEFLTLRNDIPLLDSVEKHRYGDLRSFFRAHSH